MKHSRRLRRSGLGESPLRIDGVVGRRFEPLAAALVSAALLGCGPIGSEGAPRPQGSAGANSAGAGGATGKGGAAGAGGGGGSGGSMSTDAGQDAPPSAPDTGGTTPPIAPGGYYVQGNTIYDAKGQPHLFHGLDRPSLEWNWSGDHLSADDYRLMKSWRANVVRLSLNQGFWLSGSSVYAPGYERVVEQNVAAIEAEGMDVILDLHWSDRGNFATKPAQQRMADQNSVTFWRAVAEKFKGDGRVMFELYNEPHDIPWDVWKNGGPSGDGFTVAGMQALYDAVRSTGAHNLVMIGGVRYAFDLSGVPQNRIQGYNIVYATHPYNFADKQQPSWNSAWGFLAATDPIIISEFGDTTGSCTTQYYSQVIEYANARQMSWTGWAWFVSGCAFPSLIADWSGTPTAAGQVAKAALLAY
jgi:endoglucanase